MEQKNTHGQCNHSKNSIGSRIFSIAGTLLMILGVVLLLADPYKNYRINEAVTANQIGNMNVDTLRKNRDAKVTFNAEDIKEMSAVNVIEELNKVKPEDLPMVAAIAVPRLGVNLPIYKGISNAAMYMGATTLVDGIEMGKGNYSIASHHSKFKGVLFEPLIHAKKGDIIYTTDLEKMYTWKVTKMFDVSPSQVGVLAPTDVPTLTLLTCEYNYQGRWIVQAELEEVVPFEDATKDQANAFNLESKIDDGTRQFTE